MYGRVLLFVEKLHLDDDFITVIADGCSPIPILAEHSRHSEDIHNRDEFTLEGNASEAGQPNYRFCKTISRDSVIKWTYHGEACSLTRFVPGN